MEVGLGNEEQAPVVLPLDVLSDASLGARAEPLDSVVSVGAKAYSPERQRDNVRLIVACGFLLILGYLVVFSTVEAASYPAHWSQTKEMLQIILPALTGIIGTVIGFYFGTSALGQASSQSDDSNP